MEIASQELLDALAEPTLIVDRSARVERANRRANEVAGRPLFGEDLTRWSPEPDRMATFLLRCSRSGSPLVGAVHLPTGDAVVHYRCTGSVLRSSRGDLILLRCVDPAHDRFSLLTRRIAQLNHEIGEHRHTQEVLKETLRERDLLIGEVQHRVKNNIQILLAMLNGAEREAVHLEAKSALADAARRVSAIAAILQTLYSPEDPLSCRADLLLPLLVDQLRATWPESIEVDVVADQMELPASVVTPLAMIVNELLTNSVKHSAAGFPGASVAVALRSADDQIELVVEDSGPGYELRETGKRSSGLGLVRGLVRQLGGSFTVERTKGARCIVRFVPSKPDQDKNARA